MRLISVGSITRSGGVTIVAFELCTRSPIETDTERAAQAQVSRASFAAATRSPIAERKRAHARRGGTPLACISDYVCVCAFAAQPVARLAQHHHVNSAAAPEIERHTGARPLRMIFDRAELSKTCCTALSRSLEATHPRLQCGGAIQLLNTHTKAANHPQNRHKHTGNKKPVFTFAGQALCD